MSFKIKSITLNGDGICYEVGKDGVTDIVDKSKEYPDMMEFIFYVMSNENILHEIINVPVVISYMHQ